MSGVMLCCPVKYPAGEWLHLFLRGVERLEGISRCVFTYGPPDGPLPYPDPTLKKLEAWAKETKHEVEVYREPPMERPGGVLWISAIYREYQELIRDDESHVLMMDADLVEMPADLVQRLLRLDADIAAPYVWVRDHVPPLFYDSYVFRLRGYRFHPFLPPNPGKPFRLDSVGTCVLARREVFRKFPYRNPAGHLNFCADAREAGYEVWADPTTEVSHLDLARLGIFHNPASHEDYQIPFIKNDGSVVNLEEYGIEMTRIFIEGHT